jgi:hypothetical protein
MPISRISASEQRSSRRLGRLRACFSRSVINIPWVGYAIAAAAAIALFAFRRFVGMTYAIAISAIVVATPALYLNSFALLVTAMSPFVWPVLVHPLPPGTIGGLRARTNARIVEQ